MPKYEVLISRISYASRRFEIEAPNQKAAKAQAIDKAGNHEFNEHDADYKVDCITPLPVVCLERRAK